VPVRWAHDAATKVQVLRDSVMMFFDSVHPSELAARPLPPRKTARGKDFAFMRR